MNQKERQFVETVQEYYRKYGRHDFPWRKTLDPYKILVSEVMLQQTQVDRVIPKYREFLRRFGTARRLAAAPLGEVLRAWQGLGYNRRAKFLHQVAQKVTGEMKGQWPQNELGIRSLPGVGPYTTGAVMAFAHNQPVVMIETNIRQVFLYHFFKNKEGVHDTEILELVEKTLPADNPREWYWALMDYGVHLKQQYGNVNRQSKHYTKQSLFHDSDRQIRGAILKTLSTQEALTGRQLQKELRMFESGRVATQLARLKTEGMIKQGKQKYLLP